MSEKDDFYNSKLASIGEAIGAIKAKPSSDDTEVMRKRRTEQLERWAEPMTEIARIDLVNERGNKISVTIDQAADPNDLIVKMTGPHSESTNLITVAEAVALHAVLDRVLTERT